MRTAALDHGDIVTVLVVVLCNIVGGIRAAYHYSILTFTTRIRWNALEFGRVDESIALEGVGSRNERYQGLATGTCGKDYVAWMKGIYRGQSSVSQQSRKCGLRERCAYSSSSFHSAPVRVLQSMFWSHRSIQSALLWCWSRY